MEERTLGSFLKGRGGGEDGGGGGEAVGGRFVF